jgi:hypothetical protein
MAIRLEAENLKSCNAPFPKPASVVLKRTLLAVLVNIPSPLYPVIYPVTMISTRVPPAVVCQKTGGAERGKYLLSVAISKDEGAEPYAACFVLDPNRACANVRRKRDFGGPDELRQQLPS